MELTHKLLSPRSLLIVTNSKYRAVTKSKNKWKVPEIAGLNRVVIETMETTEVEQ